jgi:methylated-DNA-[protein]-cysteine S-methyltransferase
LSNILVQNHKTPCGDLIVGAIGNEICLCDWRVRSARSTVDQRLSQYFKASVTGGHHPVIDETIEQLNEYFAGLRFSVSVPIAPAGTPFQLSVWRELESIPFGETTTYKKLAHALGNVKAVRAVANAIGANALSILVPCHRVVGSDRRMTGYAGGVVAKQTLISLELDNRFT